MMSRIIFVVFRLTCLCIVTSFVACDEAGLEGRHGTRNATIAQDEVTATALTAAFGAMLACRQNEAHECTLDYLPEFMFDNDAQRDSTLQAMAQLENNGIHRRFSPPVLNWVSPWQELSLGQVCIASFTLEQDLQLSGYTRERADAYETIVKESYGKKSYSRSEDGMSFLITAPVTVYAFSECSSKGFCFLNEDYLQSERLRSLFTREELAPLRDFQRQMR